MSHFSILYSVIPCQFSHSMVFSVIYTVWVKNVKFPYFNGCMLFVSVDVCINPLVHTFCLVHICFNPNKNQVHTYVEVKGH